MAREKKTEKAAPKAKAPAKKAAAKAPAKKEKVAKAAPVPKGGPFAKLKAAYGSKDELVKKIVEPLAAADEDTEALGDRLKKASNAQLLRLARVVETVKTKFGGRDKLIAKLGEMAGKAKDKDYLAKLGTFSLPKLLDLTRRSPRA
jgi:hypothetical protein